MASSKHSFNTSLKATKLLSDAILSKISLDIDSYESEILRVAKEMKKLKDESDLEQIQLKINSNTAKREFQKIEQNFGKQMFYLAISHPNK